MNYAEFYHHPKNKLMVDILGTTDSFGCVDFYDDEEDTSYADAADAIFSDKFGLVVGFIESEKDDYLNETSSVWQIEGFFIRIVSSGSSYDGYNVVSVKQVFPKQVMKTIYE
jgi:hypothetical protein